MIKGETILGQDQVELNSLKERMKPLDLEKKAGIYTLHWEFLWFIVRQERWFKVQVRGAPTSTTLQLITNSPSQITRKNFSHTCVAA